MITNSEQIYQFGSRVYGTYSEKSDFDFIVVLKKGTPKTDSLINMEENHYQIYSYDEFLYKIKNHDIMALECIFSSTTHRKKKHAEEFYQHFELNLNSLRESISTISNNSWVKCKKKLTVSGDYDKQAALKSCFHSIRILDFGIQIARHGSIYDYHSKNYVWVELLKLSEQYDADILWEKINAKFKNVFNSVSSEFKKLAPKDLKLRDRKKSLKELLDRNDVYSAELLEEIWNIFEN